MVIVGLFSVGSTADFECVPTPQKANGPFYKSGAPIRDSVGKGYTLSGTVKSTSDLVSIL
jgi:hypothetical protein